MIVPRPMGRSHWHSYSLPLAILFCLTWHQVSPAPAAEFTGPVVSVLDGDTIEVLHNQHPERIRLSGIDCPEKGQAYGQRAKHTASALAFGKDITVQTHGHDKYTRTLGDVILPDGMNLNQELVKQGACWWYQKYAPRDAVLEGLEKDAREGRKGLWADPQPVPPWEWRKRR
jgi:micrococcal nuclease